MTHDLRGFLRKAIETKGRPTSDYDLNLGDEVRKGNSLRSAGVLIPIVARPNGACVVLTKRSSALKHHPGQIAFPGGKVDQGDASVTDAALREAEEEIGLRSQDVELIGTLPPHETVTGFTVTPVVAMVDSLFSPVREVGEVDEVFEVPFAHVSDRSLYSVQSRLWRGEVRRYYTVAWGPYYIWGATARILRALSDRLSHATD